MRAKILEHDHTPVKSKEVAVKLFAGDRLIDRRNMDYQDDSPGMYFVDLGVLPGGAYRAELDALPAKDILASENADKVSMDFFVSSYSSLELTELTADWSIPRLLAQFTHGAVADPPQAGDLLGCFGPGIRIHRQTRQYVIWDSWPLLVLILALVTAEWLLRKKVGLA